MLGSWNLDDDIPWQQPCNCGRCDECRGLT